MSTSTSDDPMMYPQPANSSDDVAPPRVRKIQSCASSQACFLSTSAHGSGIYNKSTPAFIKEPPTRPTVRTRGLSLPSDLQTPKTAMSSRPPIALQQADVYQFTIAVLGIAGVGKSTVISKGFKKLLITKGEERRCSINSTGTMFSYGLRKAQIRFSSNPEPERALLIDISVLEVNLEDLSQSSGYSWPPFMPQIDAMMLCYDATNPSSFHALISLLGEIPVRRVVAAVVACKSDLEKRVPPSAVLRTIRRFEVGLVEVNSVTKGGKGQMRSLVDWSLRSMRRRHSSMQSPISPPTYKEPRNAKAALPSPADVLPAPQPLFSDADASVKHDYRRPQSVTPIQRPATMDTPLAELSQLDIEFNQDRHSSQLDLIAQGLEEGQMRRSVPPARSANVRDSNVSKSGDDKTKGRLTTVVYQSLDSLLHRLFHVAVSGEDPPFIEHFFLTYRRFATPQATLLGFAQRLLDLKNDTGTENLSEFAQLRICGLLEWWIKCYPSDFAASSAWEAFQEVLAIVDSTSSLFHYGPDLRVFLEKLSTIPNKDQYWSVELNEVVSLSSIDSQRTQQRIRNEIGIRPGDKEKEMTFNIGPPDGKPNLKQLREAALKLNGFPSEAIAEEITRIQKELFLAIEPRDWMDHVFVRDIQSSGRYSAILKFSQFYNHLGSWVTSLILCYDSLKTRAKQFAKFIEIARELRKHHNYAGLRSVTAGIMNATYDGDRTMEHFHEGYPKYAKNLLSYEKLFSSAKSYGAYRLAYRNVIGPVIPETEIHTYDIVRLQDISPDFHPEETDKVHWAKFNATGRLIREIMQFQKNCRRYNKISFSERKDIKDCIFNTPVMDLETQHSRVPPPELTEQAPSPAGLKRFANILR